MVTHYGSLTVAVRQENPYAALRIWPAHAFSHKDSHEAPSAGAFLPRPRYESSSAAEVKTHLWRTVAENPQARAGIAAPCCTTTSCRHLHSSPGTCSGASSFRPHGVLPQPNLRRTRPRIRKPAGGTWRHSSRAKPNPKGRRSRTRRELSGQSGIRTQGGKRKNRILADICMHT